ncbi:hypothetical protein ACWGID_07555 [Kribbella sp. NPDC054772]
MTAGSPVSRRRVLVAAIIHPGGASPGGLVDHGRRDKATQLSIGATHSHGLRDRRTSVRLESAAQARRARRFAELSDERLVFGSAG